jgi:hypothetical protein
MTSPLHQSRSRLTRLSAWLGSKQAGVNGMETVSRRQTSLAMQRLKTARPVTAYVAMAERLPSPLVNTRVLLARICVRDLRVRRIQSPLRLELVVLLVLLVLVLMVVLLELVLLELVLLLERKRAVLAMTTANTLALISLSGKTQ